MNIHAGLVSIDGRGILIAGPARSGKSSLALSLLRGATREGLRAAIVADDRTDLERRGRAVFGRAPGSISGLVEISGAGLVRLATLDEARIDLVADLGASGERLPAEPFVQLMETPVRRVFLPARQAPFGADIVLTLLLAGDDALQKL